MMDGFAQYRLLRAQELLVHGAQVETVSGSLYAGSSVHRLLAS